MQYDLKLIEKLWQKYCYRTKKGLQSDRKQIITDYEKETGITIPQPSIDNYIAKLDKEKLFNERESNVMVADEPIHVSERYIESSTYELLTPDEVSVRYGRDPKYWEILKEGLTKSKIGTNQNDYGYLINTYSKVTFAPRQFKFTKEVAELVVKSVFKNKDQIEIEPLVTNPHGFLLIPFKDMHFGLNTYEDYKKHQAQTYNYITMQDWDKITFIIGSDLFNTNDSHGRTYNDTVVDKMITGISYRMNQARMFYTPLLDAALENATTVEVMYEPGNHDKDTSLQFVTALEWLYPQIDFTIEEGKIYQEITYKNVWIGTHHGDKKNKPKAVAETFDRYFKKNIANAVYAEVLIGHLHHRFSDEHMNLFIQGLSTASNDSVYDEMMGFGKGYKAFMVRMYGPNGLKGIQIIDGE